MVDQLSRKGFRLKGIATVHTSGEVFDAGIRFYQDRGTVSAQKRIKAIVIVAVQRVAPIVSPAYHLGANEEEQREQ